MHRNFIDRAPIIARSLLLFAAIVAVGVGLVAWKSDSVRRAEAAALGQPEPAEVVTGAVAVETRHRGATTSIGTVVATRSVTLRNEVAGTVRRVDLTPGRIVDTGTVLVALDVSVEEAELDALRAQAELAESTLARLRRLAERRAISEIELDEAQAQRNIAVAEIERTRALIERKTIRAPFRARVGISDVHPGQFLDAGTVLTTLQGVESAAYVDFSVAQTVAAQLRPGSTVDVFPAQESSPVQARIEAVDARVDPTTRNAIVRARVANTGAQLAPGASVRVRIPVGEERGVVTVPVSALRTGPGGDHVFVLLPGGNGQTRAHVRPVQSGPVVDDQVVILSGLEPGETVAASGSFKLREAALVYVSNEVAANGIASNSVAATSAGSTTVANSAAPDAVAANPVGAREPGANAVVARGEGAR